MFGDNRLPRNSIAIEITAGTDCEETAFDSEA